MENKELVFKEIMFNEWLKASFDRKTRRKIQRKIKKQKQKQQEQIENAAVE